MTTRAGKCNVDHHFDSVADSVPGLAFVSPITVTVDAPSAPGPATASVDEASFFT
jgi:hypothetical protein